MLKFFSKAYLKTTFPLIPKQTLKDLMVKHARISFKDQANINRILDHLVRSANNVISTPAMASSR